MGQRSSDKSKKGCIRYHNNKEHSRTHDADGNKLIYVGRGQYIGYVNGRRHRDSNNNAGPRKPRINPNNPFQPPTPVFPALGQGAGSPGSYASQRINLNSQNSIYRKLNSSPPPSYQSNTNAAGTNILGPGPNSFPNSNKNSKDNSSWAAAQQQQQQQHSIASSQGRLSSGQPMSNMPSSISHIPQIESDRANPAGSEAGNNHRTYVVGMVGQNTKKKIDKEKKNKDP